MIRRPGETLSTRQHYLSGWLKTDHMEGCKLLFPGGPTACNGIAV